MSEDLFFALWGASRNAEGMLSKGARGMGLTAGQLVILLFIKDSPNITGKDIQYRYKATKHTITRMLTELKKRNLVEAELDKKYKRYTLTEHGSRVMKKGTLIHTALDLSLLSAISKAPDLIAQLEAIAELKESA